VAAVACQDRHLRYTKTTGRIERREERAWSAEDERRLDLQHVLPFGGGLHDEALAEHPLAHLGRLGACGLERRTVAHELDAW
jgi:hypothetical protein